MSSTLIRPRCPTTAPAAARASAALLLACALLACKSGDQAAGKAGDTAGTEAADPAARFRGQTLNLLTWEGYADPKFTKAFEDKYGVTVKGTYFGSSDELVAKLQSGGGAYDIVSPSSDVAAALVNGDLVAPVDVSRISSYGDLAETLRSMKDVQKDGKTYGVPFTWGPDYLVYDANVITEAPTSWNIFWDPAYKGKVSVWDDISNLYLVGQILGYDKQDESAIYNMSEQQLAEVKAKLIALKPQLRKFWATAGELNDLFKNKEVVLAVGWPITPQTLNKEGLNLESTIPQEGATGWIDRLMLVKGAKNPELALLYMDYITQPAPMALVAEVTGYSVANPKAAAHMSAELQANTYINELDYYFERLNFWQHVKERKRYNEVWNEVKAAN